MKLTEKEREIIEEFKGEIEEKFPDEILEVMIFGSKARGEARKESDIDIIVTTLSDNWKRGDKIREIGYELDEEIDYKLSIQVVPQSHIDYLKRNNFQFVKNIEREGIALEKFIAEFQIEDESKPYEKVKNLIGSISSGIPDLGESHREHLLKKFYRNT